jgi:DNA-binding PadR family transcriptional regulator
MVRAFLDIVIMRMLLNRPMTGYELENEILSKSKVRIGPNVIYTKLSSMEHQKLIVCIIIGRGRRYELLDTGKKLVTDREKLCEEINNSIMTIL